jgi:hypothetical protein
MVGPIRYSAVLLLPFRFENVSCASTAPPPASLWLLPSAVVPLRLSAAVCCCSASAEKNPFEGKKKLLPAWIH